jgi:serine carboxypeptidase-like clade 2
MNKRLGPLTDEIVASETLVAIRNFFLFKFPEWERNNIFLAGESYAGIYIPYLMDKIDQFN